MAAELEPRGAGPSAGLHQWQQHSQHGAAEQNDAQGIEVETRRRGPARCGKPAPRQHHGDERDGEVDEEDPAPPGVGAEGADDQPTDDGPDGGRDADGRPEHAEGTTALASREHLLDEAGDLRVENSARGPLHEPGRHEHRTGGGQTAREAGRAEEHHAADEDRPSADDIAHPARPDEGEPEREGIARDDPLQVTRRRSHALLDRGQRYVDDADVEERHEACDEADGERTPATGVRRLEVGALVLARVTPPACPVAAAGPRVLGHEYRPRMDRVASSREPPK